ncbi:MAG TPA: phosphate ABC transporter substrate-binding protein PstS [Gammaproteobacteria bacterium]|nr:phosphate ABC transporter substrate-binding protein PstS [Gammaproteobacteria bacterium]
MSLTFIKKAALAAGILTLAASAGVYAADQQLTGAGGTAIYPLLADWAGTYQKSQGVAVNYQAIGSGGGIQQIENKTVQFANSDKPLTPDVLTQQGLAQFPAVIIGITPVVNIPGIEPGQIVLNGQVLADIFLGKVNNWNDKEIAALNPGVTLPDMPVAVVHRSDGSGTTFNFTNYLSKVSDEWKTKVGSDTSVSWPTGLGGKGNAGVASFVNQVKGAIGYVEYAYALQNKMTYTKMVNHEGKTVAPELKTFQAAAANADFGKVQDFYLILTDQPGAESWPITAATYMLMRKDYPKAQNGDVLKFFNWFLTKGQDAAQKLDYVPLPESTVKQIQAYWDKQLGISMTGGHKNFH